MTRRRSSAHITLVLIGTATLVACGQQSAPLARDHYASLEDCAADWGRPESCDRVQSSGYPGGYIFRGPTYASNARDRTRGDALNDARRSGGANLADPARQGRSIGSSMAPTSPTSRGGFGSSSRSYSVGG
ncbi:MAG TPA: hypothetical protein VES91_01205 [Burkholderiaceae bacterium]|nr:hypothetical protein [Burkholderiaceae bacterium]